jgi:hypothetical protein
MTTAIVSCTALSVTAECKSLRVNITRLREAAMLATELSVVCKALEGTAKAVSDLHLLHYYTLCAYITLYSCFAQQDTHIQQMLVHVLMT